MIDRQQRQARIFAWTEEAFGAAEATSVVHRGLRMLEEAIEAAQAAGVDLAQAHRLLDFVYERPVGDLAQELGGIGITVLALAAAAGEEAEACEMREFDRIMGLSHDHFRQRNASKNAAGFSGSEKSVRPTYTAHPDDTAVDAFAAAMKAKLAHARTKGRGGWQELDSSMQQRLSDMLREHVEKGDPRDVANYCMFLFQRGETILPAR